MSTNAETLPIAMLVETDAELSIPDVEPSLGEQYEQKLAEIREGTKVVSREHGDGKVYSGTATVAQKECSAMAGKSIEDITKVIALADMADTIRALKAAANNTQKTVEKPKDTSDKKTPSQSKKDLHKQAEVIDINLVQPTTIPEVEHTRQAVSPIPRELLRQTVELFQSSAAEAATTPIEAKRVSTHAEKEATPAVPVERATRPAPPTIEARAETEAKQAYNTAAVREPRVPIEYIVAADPEYETEQVYVNESTDEPGIMLETNAVEATAIADDEVQTFDTFTVMQDGALLPVSVMAEFPLEFTGIEAEDEVTVSAVSDISEVQPDPQVEAIEASPQQVVETFVLRAVSEFAETITEVLTEMEPEAVAEIEAQVELITVVADRLHELIIKGEDTGKEAVEIVAFLADKYEKLLMSVGVEPTEELIANFISYIYSEDYISSPETITNSSDIYSEGTHEKKLFDEQSVFGNVHTASLHLVQGIGTMIGRVAVNRIAA